MRNRNNRVSTYDNGIYPIRLIVSDTSHISILKKNYRELSIIDYSTYELADAGGGSLAETRSVLDCSRNQEVNGVLVLLSKEVLDNIEENAEIVAHEAVHVADLIFESIGATTGCFSDGNEPYAYLVQWAAKNIFDHIKRINKEDEKQ